MKKDKKNNEWKDFAKDVAWLLQSAAKENSWILFFLLFVSTGIALIPLFQSFSNGALINSLAKISGSNINHALILVGCSLVIPGILYIAQRFIQKQMDFYLSKRFDILIEDKRIQLDVVQYENAEFNNFINRVNEKGVYVISNVITNIAYFYQGLIAVLFSSFIIARSSFWIFIAIFFATIPQVIINTKYGKNNFYIWGDNVNAEERRRYWSVKDSIKTLSSLTEIKLFGLGETFIKKIKNFIDSVQEKQIENEKSFFTEQFLANIIGQGVLIISIVFFVHQAVSGLISPGTVIFLFGGMASFQNSIGGLFSSLGRQKEDRMYIHDLATFLKTKNEIPDGTHELFLDTAPEISFENVSFSYPSDTKKKVYDSLSLSIAPGEKVAIVGLNGAGKTTLVKLLCRFYNPEAGKILINGKNLKDLQIDSWYKHIGILFQDFAKFDFTSVGEMITFGDHEKEMDEHYIEKSAHKADARFIEKWNNKYSQQLGNQFTDGMQPSGGQWQKLALARLFYRNPKIWILDEPTSAIDADAESKIFESLSKLPKDKTVILISHRFSTVRTADRIIVIDEGKIRENGTHEELIKLDGEYARLFNLQAEGYK